MIVRMLADSAASSDANVSDRFHKRSKDFHISGNDENVISNDERIPGGIKSPKNKTIYIGFAGSDDRVVKDANIFH